jgi:hypothetical protein
MRGPIVVLVLVSLLPVPLRAQETTLGVSYTLLSLTYPDQIPNGFGGWLTWRFIDVGINLFPEDHPLIGRQTQVLAGARGGVRVGALAVFGRLRPGFIHFGRRFLAPELGCVAVFPTPEACLIDGTNLAADVGGTVEFSPSPRAVIRVDAGDTVIRFNRTELDAVWRHNFQFSAGVGMRF